MRTKTPTMLLTAALALSLGLAACSTEEPDATTPTGGNIGTTSDTGATSSAAGDDGATSSAAGDDSATTSAAAGGYAEGACTEFFTTGGPLADRAEQARAAIDAGEVVDAVSLDQLVLLQSRIADLEEDADPEVATLLTAVNEPFTAAYDAFAAGDAVDAESGEVTLPELDTEASAAAQAELETACQG